MRRLLAFMLAHALVVSATASSLHVHEYVGHDHPDHHHGPAAHEHSTAAEPDHPFEAEDDHGLVVEPDRCDPGRHAVSVGMACAFVRQVDVDLAEAPGPVMVVATAPIRSALPITDVRAHGPPARARVPSRAPPLPHLA